MALDVEGVDRAGPARRRRMPGRARERTGYRYSLTWRNGKSLRRTVAEGVVKGIESEGLTSWLWQHLIADAISELEDEHGTEAIRTMTDERFDALLHKQLFEAQDFKEAVANLLGLYAQSWAQFLTDVLDLDHKSLPELRQWLGIGTDRRK